jgi:tetratricopeptide (TPR) repeat protein
MTPPPGPSVRVAAGAALAMSLAVVSARGAGQFAPAAVEMHAAEWRGAARAHVSGQFDGPAASIASWPPELTRVVVDRAIRRARERPPALNDRSPGTDREDDRTVLAKGLMLHTDIAIAERTSQTGATVTRAWTLLDAKPLAPIRLSIHWGLARLLAAALAKDPAAPPLARAWFRAVGALYQHWADLGQLRAHLAAAAELVPDDPVLLLYEGTLHQGYADARVQSYVTRLRGPEHLPDRFVLTLSIEDADTELGIAERALRRALAIDPSLVEARIRLAHVQGARGLSAEAIALARQALASPLPKFLEYYGAMVLGRTEARLGHHAEARAAFERAAARYPHSEAAQVALSHVSLAEGRPADGVAALVRALGPDAPERIEDPWSWYFRQHEPDAQSCLDDLRRSVK